MKRPLPVLASLGSAALLSASAPVAAINHGRMGEIFPIVETDMLSVIATRLRSLETSGGIAQLQARMQRAAVGSLRRPSPVVGLSAAEHSREWLFDPSVVLEKDIVGAQGELIAARGTRVNPLALVPMPGALVFVDGRREEELAWATRRFAPGKVKIVFVAGSPFDAMKPYQRRFWFDQRGALVTRFGIRHTPAVVTATDTHLRIAEVPVPDGPELHSAVPGQVGPARAAPADPARQGPTT